MCHSELLWLKSLYELLWLKCDNVNGNDSNVYYLNDNGMLQYIKCVIVNYYGLRVIIYVATNQVGHDELL